MSIIDGFIRRDREIARLEKLRLKLKPSDLRGVKLCSKCGFCCNVRTCIPTPDELKKIAKFLKLTPIQLINKFYAIDRKWLGSDYYVKPVGVNIKDLAGKFIPSSRTYNEGKCIFLSPDNLCKIYKVRPELARVLKCWKKDKKQEKLEEENYNKVMKSWKNNQLKQFGINGNKLESQAK